MRIWDLHPKKLCRNHLLGEHRELHALWVILTKDKKAYAHHPETNRWRGKLKALYLRHEKLVREMKERGYLHQSNLDKRLAKGSHLQREYVDSPERQVKILKNKKCSCQV
ncbi:MAG TPA: pyrimidine dimer DNA glycosylase/endonuclease V [Candidatus Omnitrophota bacterium]|nr:pyrimidine dimer DNA glycosylase/endonuclease V [Candidatus Omnitrophota bacterium]